MLAKVRTDATQSEYLLNCYDGKMNGAATPIIVTHLEPQSSPVERWFHNTGEVEPRESQRQRIMQRIELRLFACSDSILFRSARNYRFRAASPCKEIDLWNRVLFRVKGTGYNDCQEPAEHPAAIAAVWPSFRPDLGRKLPYLHARTRNAYRVIHRYSLTTGTQDDAGKLLDAGNGEHVFDGEQSGFDAPCEQHLYRRELKPVVLIYTKIQFLTAVEDRLPSSRMPVVYLQPATWRKHPITRAGIIGHKSVLVASKNPLMKATTSSHEKRHPDLPHVGDEKSNLSAEHTSKHWCIARRPAFRSSAFLISCTHAPPSSEQQHTLMQRLLSVKELRASLPSDEFNHGRSEATAVLRAVSAKIEGMARCAFSEMYN